jgi:hypothetical protein
MSLSYVKCQLLSPSAQRGGERAKGNRSATDPTTLFLFMLFLLQFMAFSSKYCFAT